MPKRLEIAAHLTVSELKTKYRETTNPVTRSQYQIIWLLALGNKTEEVAQTLLIIQCNGFEN